MLLTGLGSSGCPAPVVVEAAAEDPGPRPVHDALVAEGDRGGLNQEQVEQAFASLEPAMASCIAEGTARVAALGGRCTIALRIAADGSVESVHLSESTLGDRQTERCILDAVRGRPWPRPLGGVGEAEHQLQVEPASAVTSWKRQPSAASSRALMKSFWPCLKGVRGRFRATFYLRPDGHVLAAGVAAPNSAAADKSDCIVDALRRQSFGRQRSRLTKGTLTIP
jgi:hypothetical protein